MTYILEDLFRLAERERNHDCFLQVKNAKLTGLQKNTKTKNLSTLAPPPPPPVFSLVKPWLRYWTNLSPNIGLIYRLLLGVCHKTMINRYKNSPD